MSSLKWKRSIGRFYGYRHPGLPRKVILIYHALAANVPAVSAAAFRQQVAWLVDHATIVDLPTLIKEPGNDRGLQVALSFDDGYASLHDLAAPILQDFNAAAIVYLNSAHIGDVQRQKSDPAQGHYPAQEFLLWREVSTLLDAGWLAGSHGCHHLNLTRLDLTLGRQELEQSREVISRLTGRNCEHFAYTWGRYNSSLKAMVKELGYKSAVSGLHGPVRLDSDPYALPRVDVRADYTLDDFVAAVTGQWDWLGYKQRVASWLR
jgi:peptidoglycan/xylan/chitin deacetylase (PgdA/CDA1 family)